MPIYQRGDVSIYYEMRGNGFPLLLLPPGGMNATIAFWGRAAFNPVEIFHRDFLVVAMDQRNAGGSSGPVDAADPWGSYAADQLGLMDHLGIERFHVLGCCIGCSHALNLIDRASDRVISAVLEQPVGKDEANSQMLPNMWKEWADQLVSMRSDVSMAECEVFGRAIWAGDFVLSVDTRVREVVPDAVAGAAWHRPCPSHGHRARGGSAGAERGETGALEGAHYARAQDRSAHQELPPAAYADGLAGPPAWS